MKLESFGNLILVLASVAVVAGIAELALRLGDPVDLVPGTDANRALLEARNELRFYRRNRDRAPADFSRHDPHLGWDASYSQSRVRGGAPVGEKTVTRLVAVGDSFVFGNEVGPDENFVALLNSSPEHLEALNLGVPGYGIDQSYLKFQRYGSALDPDIVLFGIFVRDYDRAVVRFTAAAKPVFEPVDGRLLLRNVPVPAPADEFARISRTLEGSLRIKRFITSRLSALRTDQARYFGLGDQITTHVLRTLNNTLEPHQRLLIIHIPNGDSFTETDQHHQRTDAHLRDIYRRESLPVLDVAELFLAQAPAARVAERFYVISPSGSIGHFNPQGHNLVADAILAHLDLGTP